MGRLLIRSRGLIRESISPLCPRQYPLPVHGIQRYSNIWIIKEQKRKQKPSKAVLTSCSGSQSIVGVVLHYWAVLTEDNEGGSSLSSTEVTAECDPREQGRPNPRVGSSVSRSSKNRLKADKRRHFCPLCSLMSLCHIEQSPAHSRYSETE